MLNRGPNGRPWGSPSVRPGQHPGSDREIQSFALHSMINAGIQYACDARLAPRIKDEQALGPDILKFPVNMTSLC